MECFYLLTVLFLLVHGQRSSAEILEKPELRYLSKTERLASMARSARNSNAESTLVISFAVNPVSLGICYGNSTGLGSARLRLDYRNNGSDSQWMEVASGISISVGDYNTTVSAGSGCVQFRLVQAEHGGGNCNCWALSDLRVNNVSAVDLEEPPG